MVKKYSALREEVIDVFHEKNYIPTTEKNCHLMLRQDSWFSQIWED